ncbi:hypothetical protein BDR06DRAFT_956481 [Suillus hirtellus]|nr:hypothetical protein BDR06DRAFT_956481 [Suillus hirtellus]
MHFSFLVVVTALTACMSVTACSPQFTACQYDIECCPKYLCASTSVSMTSLLCIQDFLLLIPCTSIIVSRSESVQSLGYRCAGGLSMSTSRR